MANKLKGKYILIVEDDEYSSKFFSEILKSFEVNLLFCETAEESIEIVKRNNQIDIVLMDIKLPGKDGLFATRQIKEIRNNLPVIAQTAFALDGDREIMLEGGCDDYLPKPIIISDLIASIERFCD